tara:strand:+ start:402 stop:788 length:387 start_codon:yes stop_codon:yes gene_type:complete
MGSQYTNRTGKSITAKAKIIHQNIAALEEQLSELHELVEGLDWKYGLRREKLAAVKKDMLINHYDYIHGSLLQMFDITDYASRDHLLFYNRDMIDRMPWGDSYWFKHSDEINAKYRFHQDDEVLPPTS